MIYLMNLRVPETPSLYKNEEKKNTMKIFLWLVFVISEFECFYSTKLRLEAKCLLYSVKKFADHFKTFFRRK